MKTQRMKLIFSTFAMLALVVGDATSAKAEDPLPSWNDGPAKQAIVDFVRTTTENGGAKFVPPEERIATFDQDGTLWVEHPVYSQLIYCLDRVPVLAKEKPELKNVEPFKTADGLIAHVLFLPGGLKFTVMTGQGKFSPNGQGFVMTEANYLCKR